MSECVCVCAYCERGCFERDRARASKRVHTRVADRVREVRDGVCCVGVLSVSQIVV